MDSSVSREDVIWFLRVCHHVSNAVYSVSFIAVLSTATLKEYPVICRIFLVQNRDAVFGETIKKRPVLCIYIYLSVFVWYFDRRIASAFRRYMVPFTYKLISTELDVSRKISNLDIEYFASVPYLSLCECLHPFPPSRYPTVLLVKYQSISLMFS
jgi:hypothetical protein